MFSFLFGVSRRWEMILLLCSGILIVYALRVNISIAAPKMAEDLGWSETQKGFVLSAFYWGYAAGQIPASRFAQYYGAKWLFGLSVLVPSILSMFVPAACRSSYPLALTIRCILGLCESASFPAVFHFFPYWIPIEEKTIMVTTTMSGMYMGEIIGFSISGLLVESSIVVGGVDIGHWPSVFYLFGLLGIVWFPIWAFSAHETPESHPFISSDELQLIHKNKGYQSLLPRAEKSSSSAVSSPFSFGSSTPSDAKSPSYEYMECQDVSIAPISSIGYEEDSSSYLNGTSNILPGTPITSIDGTQKPSDLASRTPFFKFFTRKESLTLFMAGWVFGFIGFMLLSEMPSFLTEELNFNIVSAGALCVVPYASLFLTTLSFGTLFDYCQLHYGWSTRTVRQVAQHLAFGGSALFLLLCGFVDQVYASYAFMVIGQALLGLSQCGLACAYLDVAPRFSSSLNTVGNTIGAIAGIVGPIVVSYCLEEWPGMMGWRVVFIITACMCAIAMFFWALFQTSDIVPELNTPLPKSSL